MLERLSGVEEILGFYSVNGEGIPYILLGEGMSHMIRLAFRNNYRNGMKYKLK